MFELIKLTDSETDQVGLFFVRVMKHLTLIWLIYDAVEEEKYVLKTLLRTN
jgi:hypothetical protein